MNGVKGGTVLGLGVIQSRRLRNSYPRTQEFAPIVWFIAQRSIVDGSRGHRCHESKRMKLDCQMWLFVLEKIPKEIPMMTGDLTRATGIVDRVYRRNTTKHANSFQDCDVQDDFAACLSVITNNADLLS